MISHFSHTALTSHSTHPARKMLRQSLCKPILFCTQGSHQFAGVHLIQLVPVFVLQLCADMAWQHSWCFANDEAASSLHQALHLILEEKAGIAVFRIGFAQFMRQRQHKVFGVGNVFQHPFAGEARGHY